MRQVNLATTSGIQGKTSAADVLSEPQFEPADFLRGRNFPFIKYLFFPEIPALFSVTGRTPTAATEAITSSMEQQHKLFKITRASALI